MEELENMRKKELYLKNHLNFRAMFKVISIITVLFLSFSSVKADQNDPRLNNLFEKLTSKVKKHNEKELNNFWSWLEKDYHYNVM